MPDAGNAPTATQGRAWTELPVTAVNPVSMYQYGTGQRDS